MLCIYQKRVWEGSGDIKRSHKHAPFAQIKMNFFGLKPEGRRTNTLLGPTCFVFCYSLPTHLLTGCIRVVDGLTSRSLSNIILSKHLDAVGDPGGIEEVRSSPKIDGHDSVSTKCLCTWNTVTPA